MTPTLPEAFGMFLAMAIAVYIVFEILGFFRYGIINLYRSIKKIVNRAYCWLLINHSLKSWQPKRRRL